MSATETRAAVVDALEAPETAVTNSGGLDEAARGGLRRERRRGWLLVLLGIVMVLPLPVLLYRQGRAQDTGLETRGAVLETHRGTFDSVTVSYSWHGLYHVSVVHVDDASAYCPPDGSPAWTRLCSSSPRVIVDPDDPGHATLPRAVNFAPATLVVYRTTILLLGCCVPFLLLAAGFELLKESRRRRRHLAGHPWQQYAFQVRGSRARARRRGGLYEVSNGDGTWRSLQFVNTSKSRMRSLVNEEAVELAGDACGGQVVARRPGSTTLLTARLAAPEVSAVGSITRDARFGESSADVDGSSDAAATLVLFGSYGNFDLLGPRGESLGEITHRRRWYAVRDREDRVAVVARKRLRRYVAFDSRGGEAVSLVGRARRMSFEFPVGTQGIGRSWATSAAPLDGSANRWVLAGLTGRALARVTRIGTNYLIEIGEGDGIVGSPLVVQALLVALANPPPSST